MLKFLKKILKSIALVPSLLALCFLLIAILLSEVTVDYDAVVFINQLTFDKKEDVQYVLAFLIGGIFTLTIFSYTMVMNVLNRNINNYSPRLIPMILSEKHHQVILGFTSGTIIYSMFLSITLNATKTDYFPSIAAPLGILFGMICILLFIYFIHSVSRSIHINYIIKEAFQESLTNIKSFNEFENKLFERNNNLKHLFELKSVDVGYLKMPSLKQVESFIRKNKCSIILHKIPGEFIRKDELILSVSKKFDNKAITTILDLFPVDHNVPMDAIETGFKHLVEVGVKAMSPAINDPGTALTTIDYLTQLFIERHTMKPFNCLEIGQDNHFFFNVLPFEILRDRCYVTLYNYLKSDSLVVSHLEDSLKIVNGLKAVTPLSTAFMKHKTRQ